MKTMKNCIHYVVLCCMFISRVYPGESHLITSLATNGESETFPSSKSQNEHTAGEANRRIATNNSHLLSPYPPLTDAFDSGSRRELEVDGNNPSGSVFLEVRRKRGFFDKGQDKQRLEEEYDRSFRLFWFLAGVAIVFFTLIFILTLLCFCCPTFAKNKKGKYRLESAPNIPQISVPTEGCLDDGSNVYQPSSNRVEVEMRMRSPSVFSVNTPYVSTHRLSQEQVNAIQLLSQSRRNSALPSISQGHTSNALIDVNVIQEYRPNAS